MDARKTAESLIAAVDELGASEGQLLRDITGLGANEVATLSGAFEDPSEPMADLALTLIRSWDRMSEPERVASLLTLREVLSRPPKRESDT